MSLEIVIGPMFSGKSTYAISYIRRQKAIGKSVIAVKPKIDNRYSQDDVIVSHDKDKVPCIIWDTSCPLQATRFMLQADCIVIEEAQFFKGLYGTVEYLMKNHKKNILLVGLDGDAQQNSFGEILDCIPYATNVTKLNALCSECKDGTLAPYTKKLVNTGDQIDVGGSDKYVAVCLEHLLNV
jgi:thymidine kinase